MSDYFEYTRFMLVSVVRKLEQLVVRVCELIASGRWGMEERVHDRTVDSRYLELQGNV